MHCEEEYNARAAAAIESHHLGGKFSKLYGKDGHIVVRLFGEMSVDEFADKVKREPLWVEIDSIATPFFVTSVKGQGMSGAVVALEDVQNDRATEIIIGRNFYIESIAVRRERAGDWAMLEGCRFVDVTSGVQGVIKGVVDNSLNPLLEVVVDGGDEYFVPIAEELIAGFNKRKKVLEMELVEGFFQSAFGSI